MSKKPQSEIENQNEEVKNDSDANTDEEIKQLIAALRSKNRVLFLAEGGAGKKVFIVHSSEAGLVDTKSVLFWEDFEGKAIETLPLSTGKLRWAEALRGLKNFEETISEIPQHPEPTREQSAMLDSEKVAPTFMYGVYGEGDEKQGIISSFLSALGIRR